MPAQPYFKFFPSDWIADTRMLSNAAKGLWIDLLCQLHNSVITGVITIDITDVSKLIGENIATSQNLLDELQERKIADFEKQAGGKIKITSRRMVRDSSKSLAASEKGKKGMESRYKKVKKVSDSVITTVITDDITTTITNPNYSNSNNYSNSDNKGKGVIGEKPIWDFTGLTPNAILSLEDCAAAYAYSEVCAKPRSILCANRNVFFKDHIEQVDAIYRWCLAFNMKEDKGAKEPVRSLSGYCDHFFNWTRTQDLSKEPEKIFEHAGNSFSTRNGQQGNGTLTSARPSSAAIIPRPGK